MIASQLSRAHVGHMLRHKGGRYLIRGVDQKATHVLVTVNRGSQTGIRLPLNPIDEIEVSQ